MIVMRKTFTAQAGRIARRGFTLVEILATILVLSILAGLVLVGGRAAMRFFRGVNDKATIDNIAKALELYKSKYGEYPPDGTDSAAVRKHLLKRDPSLTKPANIGKVDELMRRLAVITARGQILTYWICGENWVEDPFPNESEEYPNFQRGKSEFIDLTPGFSSFSEIGTVRTGVNYSIVGNVLCNAKGYPVVYFRANKTAKDGILRWYHIPGTDIADPESYESIEYENGESFYNELGDGECEFPEKKPYADSPFDIDRPLFYFQSLQARMGNQRHLLGLHPYRYNANHAGELWYAPDTYQLILPGEDGLYVPDPHDPTTVKAELDNVTNFCAGATMAEEEFEGKHLESGE